MHSFHIKLFTLYFNYFIELMNELNFYYIFVSQSLTSTRASNRHFYTLSCKQFIQDGRSGLLDALGTLGSRNELKHSPKTQPADTAPLSIQTTYAKKDLKKSSSLIVGSVHKLIFFGTAAATVTKRRKFLINPCRSA